MAPTALHSVLLHAPKMGCSFIASVEWRIQTLKAIPILGSRPVPLNSRKNQDVLRWNGKSFCGTDRP